ncbi:MAG: hypothetical protein A2087_06460 [Spirochaetes bacterium GWD1_61_31]|nr:MAG: hypothetical protein A2Y37_09010 [Spirochaetes bacterium GWB1_60_80]OHD31911.1 MAG: hypothetical protein A2004_10395 [Spirochaetes bacterium GWC1_61_12]OHD39992.1 MAG: hypothetical protein A2087_06460 [Spirochaetes bacterium GWD1_61_31]OHD42354.1 MAG: hypothetical protein A2Y35_11540 [Spirochaetes bacterium GWE1_60_18]OHD60526.1 MAG: hypothetical protein A2Y32_03755 [Spirochaetes bacterium GWF1_60_12]
MFNPFQPKFNRIRNPGRIRQGHDFEFSLFAFLSMMVWFGCGVALQSALAGQPEPGLLARSGLGLVLAAIVYSLLPRWHSLLLALAVVMTTLFVTGGSGPLLRQLDWQPGAGDLLSLGFLITACLFGPSLQVITHWDKVVVLRLGRFHKVHGPGPFLLLPLIDRCAAFVDTRIRASDFSAERILTSDTVPVHVDGLAFWMIWDAQKAILEVENFVEAVTLSAQAALRDSIGKYSLTTLLSQRETLYNEIQQILDAKTNPWGITILSVEFTDIELPAELQDVMSRQAQAEREKSARLILADAEVAVAAKFRQAAAVYEGCPAALNLRAMNMVYDSLKNKGGLVLLPSTVLESMNMGSVLGLAKYGQDGPAIDQAGSPVAAANASASNPAPGASGASGASAGA